MAPCFKHLPEGVQASDATAGGTPALDDALPALDGALPALLLSVSAACSAVCSWRRSNTANKSSFDNCLAFVRKRRLRRCAFFNSAATRLRSARMRACAPFMSAIVFDKEVIAFPASPVPARSCVPMAATWLSAELAAALDDPAGASPSLPRCEPGMAQMQLRRHGWRARRGARYCQPKNCFQNAAGASALATGAAQHTLAHARGVQVWPQPHPVLCPETQQTARQMGSRSLLARSLGTDPQSVQKHQ